GKRYTPVSLVTEVGAPATPAPRSVTVTPGRIAPDSSVTLPMISPVVRCAHAGAVAATSSTRHSPSLTKPRRMFGSLPEARRTFRKNERLANLTRRISECQDEFGRRPAHRVRRIRLLGAAAA